MKHNGTKADPGEALEQRGRFASEGSKVGWRPGESFAASPPEADRTPCEVSEWVHLNEGQRIVVQREMENPKLGTIDVVSEDAFVFWVWLDNGEGRILVSAQEHVNVWRLIQPMQP